MDFFKALQNDDPEFENILKIMKLKRIPEEVDSVRYLLLTVKSVIDYNLNREDNSLRISVVYFPICNEFAQELCEDFVALKMGLYTSHEWKDNVCNTLLGGTSLCISTEVKTGKQLQMALDNFKFEKELGGILSESRNKYYDNGKTLIYSENLWNQYKAFVEANMLHKRKTVNKYWYLSRALKRFSPYNEESCPLSFVPEDCEMLYDCIVRNANEINLENFIIFPMKSPDGRYADYCADAFQKPYFDDFVSYNSRLRNVFFFCFSRKPYRLRRLFDFKQRMKERIQFTENDSFDFISFTYEEALKLNGRESIVPKKISLGKDAIDLQEDYESLFDDITNGLDRYVSRRNEMSLCITPDSVEECCSQLHDETEADENLLNEILTLNRDLWKRDVETVIHHFVFASHVYVITGNDISDSLKKLFGKYLIMHNAESVEFGTFGDLRGFQIDGEYKNSIWQNRILVVSFRNDYTESIYHKYPNSFDPYCINTNQLLLEINNYYFMRQYFDWGKYNYGKAIRRILQSEFRNSEMKPNLVEYKRPTKKLPEDTREEEMDRNTRTTQQVQVVYDDNTVRSYGRSDWMIYKNGNNAGIIPLSDLLDLYGESSADLRIQPLSPLIKSVYKDYIDAEREKDFRSEKKFKEHPSYGLTEQEINSEYQLWKILLLRKIKAKSSQMVYNEIMSHFNERYKISYQSFRKWTDLDYGIPRARKMQKYLIEDYLGIRPPYINLIRRIKERTKNDTGSITISIRHFLNISLFNKPEDAFDALSLETKDLLNINCPEDVKKIVEGVKDKIKYEQVKNVRL